MTALEAELADTIAHVARCRAELISEAKTPEHWTHHCRLSLAACGALDAISGALQSLRAGMSQISEFDAAEGIAAQLHDMASDITGRARRRMAEPAYSPHERETA